MIKGKVLLFEKCKISHYGYSFSRMKPIIKRDILNTTATQYNVCETRSISMTQKFKNELGMHVYLSGYFFQLIN